MTKKFLSYNQQMKHLRDSKSIICGGSIHKEYLCRNGYFNLINGYKKPFISNVLPDGTKKYFKSTSIEEMHALKDFDDNLRMLLLKYITKAEEEIRAFAAYKFDQINDDGAIRWYEIKAYNSASDINEIIKSVSRGYSEISKSRLDYVKHYLDCYKLIPTWIYFKIIRFSSFIDILKICKPDVCNSLCKLYSLYKSNGNVYPKLLISSLQALRKVRNACAHNERVFDYKNENARIFEPVLKYLRKSYIKDKTQKIIDILVYLKYYLEPCDYDKLIDSFNEMLVNLKTQISAFAFENVRHSMGIKIMDDIPALKDNKIVKLYNKF